MNRKMSRIQLRRACNFTVLKDISLQRINLNIGACQLDLYIFTSKLCILSTFSHHLKATVTNKKYRCYTNHALDQFLEHLIEIGVERVVRIGGQSKSTILEGKNLRVVSQGEGKTKSEGYVLGSTYSALEDQEQSARSTLGLLHGTQKRPSWANLKNHLMSRHRRIFVQFSRFDKDGFETVGPEPFDAWA